MTPLLPSIPLLVVAVAALLVASSGGYASAEEEVFAESCPLWTWLENGMPFEHTDEACNRAVENDLRRAAKITKALEASVNSGSARQLKDEQTGYCPAEDFGDSDPQQLAIGPPSLWILRNRATTPVVVSWVAPTNGNMNLEVSAVNPKVYPAHNDPKAIMKPGDWMKVTVRLGQVFHVRELVSVGGDLTPGRILVRHRPGPIPIRNRYGSADPEPEPETPEPFKPPKKPPVAPLECPVQALADPKPKPPKPPKEQPPKKADPPTETKSPAYDHNKPCNAIPAVFVNRMDCPVDVYYAGVDGERVLVSPDTSTDPVNKNNETFSGNRLNECKEVHSFHLGVNPAADGSGYFEKWDSPVVYLYTYLTHKFVARLRHDKDVVVDEIVIDRTLVEDCPSKKKKASAADAADGEGITAGVQIGGKQTTADAVVGANGETASEIVVTNFKALKNSTSASTKRNATKTTDGAKPDNSEETKAAALPEASSACEAQTNVLMSSVGN